jgi:hypothetical protein
MFRRRAVIRTILLPAAAALLVAAPAHAQFPYPPPHAYDLSASLRLQVEPKETEVFIDGYWAGTVDDFDGFFQRLHLEPGDHEVELFLEGYRTYRQKIYLQPHSTFRVRHEMQPLAPGDTADPRPAPRERTERYERPERPERAERPERYGTLALRVQPADAGIFVDGERWESPGSGGRLEIELTAGNHRLEIRKDGFATYERIVRVQPGDTTAINVSLARR